MKELEKHKYRRISSIRSIKYLRSVEGFGEGVGEKVRENRS